jgi:predicted dehydrogenase
MTTNLENREPSTVRWGILGTGTIADAFVKDLKLTGHQVAAVGSRSSETAARFAETFAIPGVHGSYEDLVADEAVDIIYVATPVTRHHDDAVLALNAGKHVLLEKPFTVNAREAQSIVDLAAERGLLLLEAMWTRWLPHIIAVRQAIADGAIGEVRAVIADHTQNLPRDPSFRLNVLELGGGALLDLGVYPIALASEVFGVPTEIEATSTFSITGVDAETGIILRYPGEKTAVIYTALNALGPNRAAIIGSDGRIEIDSIWYTPTTFRQYDSTDAVVSTFDAEVPGRGMQFQADEAERLIAANELTSDILPLTESVSIMATLDAIREKTGLRFPGE